MTEMRARAYTYVNTVLNNVDHIIPPDQQHLYHLLLGPTILGTYTNKEDMDYAAQYVFPYICCLKYIPIPGALLKHWCCIKIQSLWRGYKVRAFLE